MGLAVPHLPAVSAGPVGVLGHITPHFFGVGPGILPQRPADRLANEELAVGEVRFDAVIEEAEIRAAHKRLLRLVHPDRGGSAYLARRVYEARDTLLEQRRKTRTRTGDDE